MNQRKKEKIENALIGAKIESNVKIPSIRSGVGLSNYWRVLFEKMDVGNSVFLDGVSRDDINSVYGYAKNYGIKVAVHSVRNGVRVWLVDRK